MPTIRYKPEPIVTLLRQIEVVPASPNSFPQEIPKYPDHGSGPSSISDRLATGMVIAFTSEQ